MHACASMRTRIWSVCGTETAERWDSDFVTLYSIEIWDGRSMLERKPHVFLVAFLVSLVGLNVWRLGQWGSEEFRVYLTHAIMQTTLLDFACVLGVVVFFIRRDAKQCGLSWWWILPTFPFMPTLGILAYFIVRRRKCIGRVS